MDQEKEITPTQETSSERKILLVEDDLFVRDLYSRKLKQNHYDVDMAKDGEEGLQKATEGTYDMILLDIMLPKITGIDVLRQIKDNEKIKKTPIFLLTNLGQEAIIKDAFTMGVKGYFLKARMLPQDVVEHINEYFETGVAPHQAQKV